MHGDHVTVVAIPDYHQGAPALDQYVFKAVKDSTVHGQQLKTGGDRLGSISPDVYDDAKKQTNFDAIPYDKFSCESSSSISIRKEDPPSSRM